MQSGLPLTRTEQPSARLSREAGPAPGCGPDVGAEQGQVLRVCTVSSSSGGFGAEPRAASREFPLSRELFSQASRAPPLPPSGHFWELFA